jgi:tetratricopeptide (TPR) repeat protein
MSPPDDAPAPVSAHRAAIERVVQALRADQLDEAKVLALDALAQGAEHTILLNLRAMTLEDEGRYAEALKDLRRAHFLSPRDFGILNACGLCLARMDRHDEALQCYDQALALEQGFGPLWFNRAWVLERLGEKAKAAQSYAKAVEINPQNAHAWANAATLAVTRGDAGAAIAMAQKALALEPDNITALLAIAAAHMGEPAEAERRLRAVIAAPVLGPFDRALAFGQLGDALDAQGRSAEAFDAYAHGNALFQEESRARFEAPGKATVPDTQAWLIDWAEALPPGAWAGAPEGGRGLAGETGHVFLLGFPRSGTTLMESALGAHPEVASLEERATMGAAIRAFLDRPQDLTRLGRLSRWELQPFRADYWNLVRSFGVEPRGRVFIDKHPFNVPMLPVIARLFPGAKVIFARRDPRDVVLSCFRRRFNINASTYEFLDLRRTAAYYDRTMRLAALFREKTPYPEHVLSYERLVADFSGEMGAVCDFIGIDLRPQMLDFAGRARRGDVASASSAQIARGLYADGAGQWRRYREQLEPVMDLLAPWVEKFGYPID